MRLQGFTLLEMMASVLVLALLATSFYAPRVLSDAREFKRAQAITTAEQINRIASSAQRWALSNHGRWPDQEQQCGNLFSLLIPHYLSGLDEDESPPSVWRRQGLRPLPIRHVRWQGRGEIGRYYAWCSPEQLQLDIFLAEKDALWAHYMKNRLAGSEVTSYTEQNMVRLRSSWPLPTALPALAGLVSKARPEFSGAMHSNIDMGKHALIQASDVVLHNGHSLGKTFSYVENIQPRQVVTVPQCAPGLKQQGLASFSRILHRSGKPINFSSVVAIPLLSVPNRWGAYSEVVDSAGVIDANNPDVRINLFVRCS